MPNPTIHTNFNGIQVDAKTAEDLKKHPSSEFLYLQKNDDGTYTVQTKIPEWGHSEGKDFRLRENFNYFVRGFARSILDENGEIDFQRADKLSDELTNGFKGKGYSEEFIRACGVPEERKAEFYDFLRICSIRLEAVITQALMEFDKLQRYRYNVNIIRGKLGKNPEEDAAYRILKDSYADYQNILAKYTRMANMDPETEMGILNEYKSESYIAWNTELCKYNNAYRKNKKLPEIMGKRHNINIQDEKKNLVDDPEKNRYLKYNGRMVFTLETSVDGKTMLLVLEAIENPAGKLLHCSKNDRIGVGLYNDTSEIDRLYREDPFVEIPNMPLYLQLEDPRTVQRDMEMKVKDIEKFGDGEEFGIFLLSEVDRALEKKKAEENNLSKEQKEKVFSDIEDKIAVQKLRSRSMTNLTYHKTLAKHGEAVDDVHLSTKAMLSQFANLYQVNVNGDKKLEAILSDIRAFAAEDTPQDDVGVIAELDHYQRIYVALKAHFQELDAKQIGIKADPKKGIEGYDPEDETNRMHYQITADLFNFFESRLYVERTAESVSDCGRELNVILSSLDRTGKDSKEFGKLYGSLKAFARAEHLSHILGDEERKFYKSTDVSALKHSCENYLKYCRENRKGGDRRKNRIRQANKLMTIVNNLEKGYEKQKDALAEKLMTKMMTGNKLYAALSDEQKSRNVRKFTNSMQFQRWKKAMSVEDMTDLSEKSSADILQVYKEKVLEHFAKEGDVALRQMQPKVLKEMKVMQMM